MSECLHTRMRKVDDEFHRCLDCGEEFTGNHMDVLFRAEQAEAEREQAEVERDQLKGKAQGLQLRLDAQIKQKHELKAIVDYFANDDRVREVFGFRLTPEELIEIAKNQVAMMTQSKIVVKKNGREVGRITSSSGLELEGVDYTKETER